MKLFSTSLIFLIVLCICFTPAQVQANQSHNPFFHPGETAQAGWNAFQAENPEAVVHWGKRLQRPQLLYRFNPVASGGRFDETVHQFIHENAAMFGISEPTSANEVLTQLAPGQIHFRCRKDEMNPLPGLLEDQYYEPQCPDITVIKFVQLINGLPFLDNPVGVVFDRRDQMTSLIGEYLGLVSVNATFTVTYEIAIALIAETLNVAADELFIDKVESGYIWLEDLIPVWRIRVMGPEASDVTFTINADSAEIVRTSDNVDHSVEWSWGNTMDNEAALECNEPAFRHRDIDTTYRVNGIQGAFDEDVHVYDMSTENNCNVYPRGSNDTYLLKKSFNYRIDPTASCTPTPCNNDNNPIPSNGISTYTAFVHTLNALNYFRSMGFQEDGGNYPDDHNLNVVVNKPASSNVLCGQTSACFREKGFPDGPQWIDLGGGTGYWDYDCTNTSYDNYDLHYFFYYTEDRYNYLQGIWHPTMILSDQDRPPYYDIIGHPLIYHEFTHYIQKRYATSSYWRSDYEKDIDFAEFEGGPFKEGFAYYFAGSMEEEGPHNFYRAQLRCDSDEMQYSKSMNQQYDIVFQCCGDEHNAGYVISQIFWDMREGIGTDDPLGKAYTDQLAFMAIMELPNGGADTTQELYFLTLEIAYDPEMEELCPLANVDYCALVITQAFLRHGLCFMEPCNFQDYDCGDSECSNAHCMRSDPDNCSGVTAGGCSGSSSIYCCADVCANNYYHSCVSQSVCEANCIENLYSYERRVCIDNFGSGDACNKCNGL